MTARVEPNPKAAVIVPTHNRPVSLARCLDALDRQEGISRLEVVVVDDGSAHAAEVAAIVAASTRGRLLRCEQTRGPAAARNAGARVTNAFVLLFTDDDCEPARDWAARLAAAVQNGAHAAAGLTGNGRPDDALASASETILEYVQARARGAASTTTFAATNNLACTANLLAEIPFDEAYRYGEDRDWCTRLLAAGYSLVVEPAARVLHHQDLQLASFLRQQYGYGRAACRFRRQHASARRLESPEFYTSLLRRGFAHGVVPGMLVGVAQGATAAGFVREALTRRGA
jgi:GT2 family glycosyltransferase